MRYLFEPSAPVAVPVEGQGALPVRRIFCVGRNYAAHAAEMGAEVDREAPFYFTKTPHHVTIAGGTLAYPPGTRDLHHEVELCVALGRGGVVIAAGVALDMTRRDLQATAKAGRRPWDAAKDFAGSAVLAPMRELEETGARAIALTLNGEIRQSGNTRDLIWSVPALVAHLGGLYALGPGDLILTGTPAGVGPVVPGDRLVGRIDGLPDLTVEIAHA